MRVLTFSVLSCVLAVCSSGSGGLISSSVAAPASAPGGVYVGYYQEDPVTNPEDPTIGSVYLNLPASDSQFTGNMYFTYFGCQRSNVGTISGSKAGTSLNGNWTGTLDGTHQTGSFKGAYTAAQSVWAGDYTVSGGKQHISVPSCISYFVAPKGTFELFAIGQSTPSSFAATVNGNTVRWNPPAGAAMTLVYVVDPAIASSGGTHATVWQTLVLGTTGTQSLGSAKLVSGHRYVVAVGATDDRSRRLAFSSAPFTAP